MKLKLTASTSNPPVGSLIVRSLCSSAGLQVDVNWGQTTFLEGVNPESLSTDSSISRYFARVKPELRLYGGDVLEQAQVDHWIGVAQGQVTAGRAVDEALKELDSALERTTYLIGSSATIADYLVFAALNGSKEFKKCLSASTVGVNLSRWYDFISASPVVKEVLDSMPATSKSGSQEAKQRGKKAGSPAVRNKGSSSAVSSSALPKEEGKFVALPGAEMGKVVVRFPPEASGYLHIGHAKAALLNQHYQLAFQGKLILRFDDTNPEKEKEDFERVILQDVELLNIKPDMFTFTSNFFDEMLVYCEKLIREGKAFVDDTEPELMKEEREQKVDSKNRSNSVEKNLALWEEMQNGTEKGLTCCVRAKIAMDSPNGCMRDPTIYRCKPQPHPKTGLKYKVYPTYDFACPIVDSLEGVTHALRTTEYHDRDDQYFWFIDALGLRKPYIYEYSRLNMTNTVLSKRRLRWIVDNGLVEGWDDPRFPTVRGILRRGLTVEGLKQFILAQGSSKSVVVMEWDKIWAFNKKVIDPVAPRYTCVDREANIEVHVKNSDGSPVKPEKKAVPVHPKNKDGPQKELWLGPVVLIDNNDAEVLVEGQNATFINWGNLRITKIHKNNGRIEKVDATTNLLDEDYKKTPKITWLAESGESPVIPVECVFYDNIISKPILGKDEDFKAYINPHTRLSKSMLGERTLASLKRGDIIQIQRVGFFICDGEYMENNPMTCRTEPLLLNYIPDGKEDPEWVKILKAEATGQVRPSAPTPASKSASATSVKSSPAAAKPAQRTAAAVDADIKAQGEKVRALKAEKADKAAVDVEVKSLLALKAEFKSLTGLEWKPGVEIPASQPSAPTGAGDASDLDSRIRSTGDEVRSLKSSKAPKDKIDAEVKLLLSLKEEFKKVSGITWTPDYKPASKDSGSKSAADIDAAIVAQGDKVRSLKSAKAEKAAVEAEVKALLSLKAEYKSVTGSEWKLGAQPTTSKPESTPQATPSGSKSAAEINAAIAAQGDKVRSLKAAKADKSAVEAEVKALLSLKAEYKSATGSEWKPGAQPPTSKPESTPQATPSGSKSAAEINAAIAAQGDKVRSLKAAKAEKSAVEAEVKALLNLKAEYKSVTGSDWKPGAQPPQQSASKSAADLNAEITSQGNKIRDLKSSKAPKTTLDPEIQKLLALKAEYKTVTGTDWKPDSQPAMSSQNGVNGAAGDNAGEALKAKITEQGAKVKKLKDSKAPAEEVDKEVQELLKLKKDLLELTGEDLLGGGRSKSKASKPAKAAAKPAPKKEEPKESKDGGLKHQTRLGLEAKKEENLPDWYTQVITKSEMIEYYDVSGCYIFRPWSYQIWEEIVKFFDGEIKKLGVQNCYFPMFVTKGALEREQTHVADFAPEVAWVTKSGQSDLAEPIAIRPTSETVMYPAYAKWIQSYRDLPIRLNQWNSVVRWEFKHPQPFLRTREFLWQEGHSAFAKKEEAEEEVYTILNLYRRIYEELLAIPVVRGKKTEKEKFAGGDFTTTTEAFISASGRGIQGATSHHLGQNFSKMFDIVYDDPETGEKRHVYQNSWGITTRTIGVVVMVHGDNTGLVLPPRIAPLQVVIVPCGVGVNTKPEDAKALMEKCEDYCKRLKDAGVRVRADLRDNYSPGWKFNHWELKGVPIRIELGPRDMGNKQFVAVRRDTGEKLTYGENILDNSITELLETIHVSMFNKAKGELDNHLVISESWDEFCNKLNEKCIILAPFCGDGECEEVIKKESARDEAAEPGAPAMGAKSLCIPFEQPKRSLDDKKCIHPRCSKKPQFYTLFGRSY